MFAFIKILQQKPEPVKKTVAAFVAGFVTLAIFMFWISENKLQSLSRGRVVGIEAGTTAENVASAEFAELSPFKNLKRSFTEIVENFLGRMEYVKNYQGY